MSKFRIEHNVETNEIIQISLTSQELKDLEKLQTEAIKLAAKSQTEAEAKETAKAAILDRIGLTANELKTILG
jgi:hypothetical protein